MPLLSDYARRRKARYFLDRIPKDARILEVGSGGGWVGEYLRRGGWSGYTGLDIRAPAEVVGDIRHWRELGLAAESFDVIVAFEVVEHVDCFAECYDLLKPGGQMIITTPLPRADRILWLFERIGLNQKRRTPHGNLVDLKTVEVFPDKKIRIVGLMSQWAFLRK